MKFAKILQEFEAEGDEGEQLPDCFLSYKKLKKLLKIAAEEQEAARAKGDADRKDGTAGPEARADPLPMTAQEKEFISTLNKDLSRINAYFMEREEDAVIKLQTLVDRKLAAEAAGASLQEGEAEALRSAFVDFHGELVLLLHWSLVNYAGVVKILKKHDKLLGGHAQGVYLANVLHQPFTSTESISRLVRDTEAQVRSVATLWHAQVSGAAKRSKASVSRSQKEATVLKRTRAALGMLAQLQDTAHTPSTLLPSGTSPEESGKRQKVDA